MIHSHDVTNKILPRDKISSRNFIKLDCRCGHVTKVL